MTYIGKFENKVADFQYDAPYMRGEDRVLAVTDALKDYVKE